jgi:hypothetical protein
MLEVCDRETPLLDLVEHHFRRHQLGHAGRRRRHVGALFIQHRAGLDVDEDGVGRRGLEIILPGAGSSDITRRRHRCRLLPVCGLHESSGRWVRGRSRRQR